MTETVQNLLDEIEKISDPLRASHAQRFFKTGPGQYGEGDVFVGITMPQLRRICRQYKGLNLNEIQKLLDSPIHEHRMAALVIMSDVAPKRSLKQRKELFALYLKNLDFERINNWDLVDVSAKSIVGDYCADTTFEPLLELAHTPDLWKKRVAIVATFAFLARNDASPTIKIAEVLLDDKHDLLQKAVGWLLREMGKRVSEQDLILFLDKHASSMPRTTLRYAIERFPQEVRQHYMQMRHLHNF